MLFKKDSPSLARVLNLDMHTLDLDLEQFEFKLDQFYSYSIDHGLFFFVILSSSVEDKINAYLGGVRLTDSFLLVSIVNLKQSELESLVPFLDCRASALFVDVEKKHPFHTEGWIDSIETKGQSIKMNYSNIYAAAFELFKHTMIIPWSPSRITSECAIKVLRQRLGGNLSGQHVTVIGIGSVGFKLALGLVEEGCNVSCFSRNIEKTSRLVQSINEVKSSYTISSALHYSDINTAIASSNNLAIATSSRHFINRGNLLFRNLSSAFILDVGKESLSIGAKEVVDAMPGLSYLRLDITSEIIQFVFANLSGTPLTSMPQRCKSRINGQMRNVVSGGFPGSGGDLVVDNALNPQFILGYMDNDCTYFPAPDVVSK